MNATAPELTLGNWIDGKDSGEVFDRDTGNPIAEFPSEEISPCAAADRKACAALPVLLARIARVLNLATPAGEDVTVRAAHLQALADAFVLAGGTVLR